jgi:hypothetical protein
MVGDPIGGDPQAAGVLAPAQREIVRHLLMTGVGWAPIQVSLGEHPLEQSLV